MTELYKKNGAVFIPSGITIEDVKKLKKENEELEQLKIKIKALEVANKAMVKEIDDLSSGGLDVLLKVTKLKEELEQKIEIMKNCTNC